jgi:tetratricopeptide (TPR) repeat protein
LYRAGQLRIGGSPALATAAAKRHPVAKLTAFIGMKLRGFMILSNRLSIGLAVLAGLAWSTTASATAVVDSPVTLAGSYLAARSADQEKDIGAAAEFYGEALANDPSNPVLLERTLILKVANGDVQGAFDPAQRLIAIDSGNPIARMVLAVRSVKQKDYAAVPKDVADVAKAPLATLTVGLIEGWAEFGLGKTDEALTTIDSLSGPNWYDIFKDYHRALILDAAGRTNEAVTAITKAYNTDGSALRVVEGYARILARAGQRDKALKALNDFASTSPLRPAVKELLDELRTGKPIAPVAKTADEGVAEALYGLGSAIGTDGGPELPIGYLQLARYLDPTLYLADMAIGDVLQASDRCDDSIASYERVPQNLALRRNADLQIAACLQALGHPEKAVSHVESVLNADPNDIEAAVMLGDIYRAINKFPDAAKAYSRGIAAIKTPSPDDWRLYYYRGVSEERSKDWPAAEADFQHALKLNPEQPSVLNYLGYSWVDKGMNLDKALAMIKQAVDLRPNDGYIVDSLGWAYYKLHRYQDAVTTLERAIQLRPEDSTINDHLGDAYWQIGRKLDATFQWTHAKDMNPEPDALPAILDKLKHGLKTAADGTAKAGAAQEPNGTTTPDPNAHGAQPKSTTVGHGESLWNIAVRVYGNAAMYQLIYKANRDRISDPNHLVPGMTLNLPSASSN